MTIDRRSFIAAGLGAAATLTLETTIADTLTYWRELPEERRAKPKAGLTPAREAEVLAAWHARKRSGG